jgi:hydrocephalus-inducing protein
VDSCSPFTVTPDAGCLKAGERQELTIRFSPVDVLDGQHLLCVDFPRLADGLQPLQITLAGSVVRPWCYMEVPASEYLTAGNRKPSPGSLKHGPVLDPDTTVIEIKSLGQDIANHHRFHVLNPTNVAYEFHWELAAGTGGNSSPFKCYTSKGIISAGRRYEMAFEFLPNSTDVQESLWTFSIPVQVGPSCSQVHRSHSQHIS